MKSSGAMKEEEIFEKLDAISKEGMVLMVHAPAYGFNDVIPSGISVGSKGVLDIVKKYQEYIGPVISEPDKGLYDAMNKGIAMATGDVVGLLNSDDFYTSDDILATVAREFSCPDVPDAIYGDVHYVDENDKYQIDPNKECIVKEIFTRFVETISLISAVEAVVAFK